MLLNGRFFFFCLQYNLTEGLGLDIYKTKVTWLSKQLKKSIKTLPRKVRKVVKQQSKINKGIQKE